MRKLTILIGLVLLTSCSLFEKPVVIAEPVINVDNEIILNEFLSAQKFEIEGVTYYWVHKSKSYKFYEAHVICPERDKALIEQ